MLLEEQSEPSALRANKSEALDWNRFDIYDKAANWFDVTGKVLQDPAVLLQENVYNVGQTGVMLSNLNWVKVLVRTGDYPGDSGARVKRTTIAAVECVSASGKVLDPMIIWLASTHRANWTTQPTLGWHLQWLKLAFDPQAKERANRKPRVLICDGF
ncbi:hypothetical protein LTR02_017018 [Friedmanniomyces endolithicus]|nr:hypothetical protein LTR94_021914 [Friedmanniomyces endolithicus]KAK0768975.1 hypothetical protein LTR59_017308 [Friedmanniomyces endolithicus]KAK0771347.1 hypothetical protein LTR38_017252 [Friedmanniomyces endolithicus]KAK0773347.1 hypothetical protein LTR75_017158 [Friedmanniomyces endolithicus]KAK0826250.1 hypothetical protein LTR03_017244 [Friedmanniomyces endolithicus]